MTKREAIRQVACNLAAQLDGSTFAEATGYDNDVKLSDADMARLSVAINVVSGRLWRIGGIVR